MSRIKQRMKNYIPEIMLNTYRFIFNSNIRKKILFRRFGIRYAPKLPDFPSMVMIDTITKCNLACNHCPNRILSSKSNLVGEMKFSLFKKIIDEIAAENPNTIVRPFDGGEPLFRDDIEELIKYAKMKGIKHVSLNTNGTLLSEKRAYSILDSGLDHIEFSIDAFSERTFKAIKNINLYKTVIKNVERLMELKDRVRPNFKISVSFVKQKDNYQECEKFYQYWSEKVNYVTIREYHMHGGLVRENRKYVNLSKKYRHPCPYLWNRVIIQHNGDVRFCENDWKAEHVLGNVKDQPLKKIWLSDGYHKLRMSHVRGTFDHPFCNQCPDWQVIGE